MRNGQYLIKVVMHIENNDIVIVYEYAISKEVAKKRAIYALLDTITDKRLKQYDYNVIKNAFYTVELYRQYTNEQELLKKQDCKYDINNITVEQAIDLL